MCCCNFLLLSLKVTVRLYSLGSILKVKNKITRLLKIFGDLIISNHGNHVNKVTKKFSFYVFLFDKKLLLFSVSIAISFRILFFILFNITLIL